MIQIQIELSTRLERNWFEVLCFYFGNSKKKSEAGGGSIKRITFGFGFGFGFGFELEFGFGFWIWSKMALRQALTRMGFSADAAREITTTQGIDSMAEFEVLSDTEVSSLCGVVMKPGGMDAHGNQNNGLEVALRAENNLKLMCYFIQYQTRTSRAVNPAEITLENVRMFKDLREWETNQTNPDAPTINEKDWPKTMDAIKEWLRGCLGVTKIPLAYVIRENPLPGNDEENSFPMRQDELIRRAPHSTTNANGNVEPNATFLSDRSKVWEFLSKLCQEKDCWTYMRAFQRTKDGRGAFLALKNHYLCKNNVDNMLARAESLLRNTKYEGEKRRWNFEKYVRIHVEQHAILQSLKAHGYAGIDERSKV